MSSPNSLPDNNFFSSPEPYRSCLICLRDFFLRYSENITEKWSFNTPFYYFRKQSLAFISYHPKTKIIYVAFTDGGKIKHPKLISEGRKKQKIFYVDPEKDIDLKSLRKIVDVSVNLKKVKSTMRVQ